MEDIKSIIQLLLENIGTNDALIEVYENGDSIFINIDSRDETSLVGRDCERFEALSHIAKRMIAKKYGESKRVVLDVNGVLKKKDETLKNKASMMAERARAFKINVELDPMSSYERMLVHSHLEGSPNIKTESIGEGRDRRLVIKFIEETVVSDQI